MNYYKLIMNIENDRDAVCYCENDFGIPRYSLDKGKFYEWKGDKFELYYDKGKGNVLTDYLANNKGWFLVSSRLKNILLSLNTEIQFLPTVIREKNSSMVSEDYYIANILSVVDALCLEKSDYFKTEIPGMDTIYTVSKYGIYADKTNNLDVFKLSKKQEIPIFVSERFKKMIESEKITGISLLKILAI